MTRPLAFLLALLIGLPAPALLGSQALAAEHGAASSSRSHHLRPSIEERVEADLASGLEEGAEDLATILEVPTIQQLSAIPLERIGEAYLLDPRPTTSDLKDQFESAQRELWSVGFKHREAPHLVVGVGREIKASGITHFLGKLYSRTRPTSVRMLHKHPVRSAIPSHKDFSGLKEWRKRYGKSVRRQRNWINGADNGIQRFVEYGHRRLWRIFSSKKLQARIWRGGPKKPAEAFFIPGTDRWHVSDIRNHSLPGTDQEGHSYFFSLVDTPGVQRVEFNDHQGRWASCSASDTWEELLESQGYTRPAYSGLEEEWVERIRTATQQWQAKGWKLYDPEELSSAFAKIAAKLGSGLEKTQALDAQDTRRFIWERRQEFMVAFSHLAEALHLPPENNPLSVIALTPARGKSPPKQAVLDLPYGEGVLRATIHFQNPSQTPRTKFQFQIRDAAGTARRLGEMRMGADKERRDTLPLLHIDVVDPLRPRTPHGEKRKWIWHLGIDWAFTQQDGIQEKLIAYKTFQDNLGQRVRQLSRRPTRDTTAASGQEEPILSLPGAVQVPLADLRLAERIEAHTGVAGIDPVRTALKQLPNSLVLAVVGSAFLSPGEAIADLDLAVYDTAEDGAGVWELLDRLEDCLGPLGEVTRSPAAGDEKAWTDPYTLSVEDVRGGGESFQVDIFALPMSLLRTNPIVDGLDALFYVGGFNPLFPVYGVQSSQAAEQFVEIAAAIPETTLVGNLTQWKQALLEDAQMRLRFGESEAEAIQKVRRRARTVLYALDSNEVPAPDALPGNQKELGELLRTLQTRQGDFVERVRAIRLASGLEEGIELATVPIPRSADETDAYVNRLHRTRVVIGDALRIPYDPSFPETVAERHHLSVIRHLNDNAFLHFLDRTSIANPQAQFTFFLTQGVVDGALRWFLNVQYQDNNPEAWEHPIESAVTKLSGGSQRDGGGVGLWTAYQAVAQIPDAALIVEARDVDGHRKRLKFVKALSSPASLEIRNPDGGTEILVRLPILPLEINLGEAAEQTRELLAGRFGQGLSREMTESTITQILRHSLLLRAVQIGSGARAVLIQGEAAQEVTGQAVARALDALPGSSDGNRFVMHIGRHPSEGLAVYIAPLRGEYHALSSGEAVEIADLLRQREPTVASIRFPGQGSHLDVPLGALSRELIAASVDRILQGGNGVIQVVPFELGETDRLAIEVLSTSGQEEKRPALGQLTKQLRQIHRPGSTWTPSQIVDAVRAASETEDFELEWLAPGQINSPAQRKTAWGKILHAAYSAVNRGGLDPLTWRKVLEQAGLDPNQVYGRKRRSRKGDGIASPVAVHLHPPFKDGKPNLEALGEPNHTGVRLPRRPWWKEHAPARALFMNLETAGSSTGQAIVNAYGPSYSLPLPYNESNPDRVVVLADVPEPDQIRVLAIYHAQTLKQLYPTANQIWIYPRFHLQGGKLRGDSFFLRATEKIKDTSWDNLAARGPQVALAHSRIGVDSGSSYVHCRGIPRLIPYRKGVTHSNPMLVIADTRAEAEAPPIAIYNNQGDQVAPHWEDASVLEFDAVELASQLLRQLAGASNLLQGSGSERTVQHLDVSQLLGGTPAAIAFRDDSEDGLRRRLEVALAVALDPWKPALYDPARGQYLPAWEAGEPLREAGIASIQITVPPRPEQPETAWLVVPSNGTAGLPAYEADAFRGFHPNQAQKLPADTTHVITRPLTREALSREVVIPLHYNERATSVVALLSREAGVSTGERIPAGKNTRLFFEPTLQLDHWVGEEDNGRPALVLWSHPWPGDTVPDSFTIPTIDLHPDQTFSLTLRQLFHAALLGHTAAAHLNVSALWTFLDSENQPLLAAAIGPERTAGQEEADTLAGVSTRSVVSTYFDPPFYEHGTLKEVTADSVWEFTNLPPAFWETARERAQKHVVLRGVRSIDTNGQAHFAATTAQRKTGRYPTAVPYGADVAFTVAFNMQHPLLGIPEKAFHNGIQVYPAANHVEMYLHFEVRHGKLVPEASFLFKATERSIKGVWDLPEVLEASSVALANVSTLTRPIRNKPNVSFRYRTKRFTISVPNGESAPQRVLILGNPKRPDGDPPEIVHDMKTGREVWPTWGAVPAQTLADALERYHDEEVASQFRRPYDPRYFNELLQQAQRSFPQPTEGERIVFDLLQAAARAARAAQGNNPQHIEDFFSTSADRIQQREPIRVNGGLEETGKFDLIRAEEPIPPFRLPELPDGFRVSEGTFPLDPSTAMFSTLIREHPELFQGMVLDLGTGSGALAIQLARQGATVVGIDKLRGAIDDARHNLSLESPEVQARVTFGVSDLYENLPQITGEDSPQFDVVIYNNGIRLEKVAQIIPRDAMLKAGEAGEEVARAVSGLDQVLTPNGRSFFLGGSDRNLVNLFGWGHFEEAKPEGWRVHPTTYKKSMARIVRQVLIFRVAPPGVPESAEVVAEPSLLNVLFLPERRFEVPAGQEERREIELDTIPLQEAGSRETDAHTPLFDPLNRPFQDPLSPFHPIRIDMGPILTNLADNAREHFLERFPDVANKTAQLKLSVAERDAGDRSLIIRYQDNNPHPWEIPIDEAVRGWGESRKELSWGIGEGLTGSYRRTMKLGGRFTVEGMDPNEGRTRLIYAEPDQEPAPEDRRYQSDGTEIVAELPIQAPDQSLEALAESFRQSLASGQEGRSDEWRLRDKKVSGGPAIRWRPLTNTPEMVSRSELEHAQRRAYDEHIFDHLPKDLVPALSGGISGLLAQFEQENRASGKPFAWWDGAGGIGTALHQARGSGHYPHLVPVLVDLVNWKEEELPQKARGWLRQMAPIWGVDYQDFWSKKGVGFISGDLSTLYIPPEEASSIRLFTIIGSLGFFDNPLGALLNVYNQLPDDAILLAPLFISMEDPRRPEPEEAVVDFYRDVVVPDLKAHGVQVDFKKTNQMEEAAVAQGLGAGIPQFQAGFVFVKTPGSIKLLLTPKVRTFPQKTTRDVLAKVVHYEGDLENPFAYHPPTSGLEEAVVWESTVFRGQFPQLADQIPANATHLLGVPLDGAVTLYRPETLAGGLEERIRVEAEHFPGVVIRAQPIPPAERSVQRPAVFVLDTLLELKLPYEPTPAVHHQLGQALPPLLRLIAMALAGRTDVVAAWVVGQVVEEDGRQYFVLAVQL